MEAGREFQLLDVMGANVLANEVVEFGNVSVGYFLNNYQFKSKYIYIYVNIQKVNFPKFLKFTISTGYTLNTMIEP